MTHIISIGELSSLLPEELLQVLLKQNLPLQRVINALLANLSQKKDSELLAIIQRSNLVNILTTFRDLVQSGVIDDLDVDDLIRENFSSLEQGQQHLFAVLAFLQLLRSSGDAETPEEAQDISQTIEDLKELFRLTLFDSRIAIQLMNLRDEKQGLANQCPCTNCNAKFILSIGWYIAAQEAHDKNMFVSNSN